MSFKQVHCFPVRQFIQSWLTSTPAYKPISRAAQSVVLPPCKVHRVSLLASVAVLPVPGTLGGGVSTRLRVRPTLDMWYFCAVFLLLFSLIQSVGLHKKILGTPTGGGRPPLVNPPLCAIYLAYLVTVVGPSQHGITFFI